MRAWVAILPAATSPGGTLRGDGWRCGPNDKFEGGIPMTLIEE